MTHQIPDLKWAFQIDPSYSWFESFVQQFDSPDLSFIVDHEDDKPDAYGLSSLHFSELSESSEILDRAISLKAVLDGAFYLKHGFEFFPFQLGRLVSLTNETIYRQPRTEYEQIMPPFSAEACNWIPQWKSLRNPFDNLIGGLLWLAREDELSRGLLYFLGFHGCTWISLYALLDFMKTGGLSVKKIAEFAQSSVAEIKRFTHTANNFAAIGPLCRHGDRGKQPPQNPMLRSEAALIMIPAARRFLLNRIDELNLRKQWSVNSL